MTMLNTFVRCGFAGLLLMGVTTNLSAQIPAFPDAGLSARSLEQRRADFTKLKFGMFIHFNMGTFHEQEWVLPGRDPSTFNPVKLDCGQWADAARSAGMKYAVLTAKHHDGFCLWDSQTTTYDVAASPLKGRDIVREYCDAFRQRGIEPHFYFSIWDRQLGIEKQITPEEISIIKAQLTELLTHYGKIGSLTFDGWGNCGTEWTQADRDAIYAHVKSLQPQILVTDHYQLRRKLPLEEVYQVVDFFHYEEPIGEWAPAGNVFVSQQGPTLQSAWFWKRKFPSEGLMSVDDIVEKRLKVLNTRNCNFLLNCAPNRDGLLDENVVRRLAEVGKAWQPGDSVTHAWGNWQSWGDQGDSTYRNPVLPADYSDIDCIRVGSDYYAISSTFQYSPGMVVLQAKDLVNWRIAGHAVPDVTQISPKLNWDRMDRFGAGIWAGAIRHHAGKFWVYFGTPDEGYFMTTATNIAGPWSPLTHVLKARGWDDCCPFWDDDGQGYLIGSQFDKDPVNGKKYNIHLWKLSADGKSLVTESDKILYQSNGSEANKLYKWNGTYYHYFSEVRAEGRVPMMGRATNIAGPYEYRQIGHVKKGVDYEPNQGGIVLSESGDWWFFTHHGSGDWSGRIASLLPVTWTNGWPIIGEPGADGIGNMVWSAAKPVKGTKRLTPQTDDEFSAATLAPQWEWHYQPRAEKWSLTERPGFLRLHAFKGLHGDNLLKVGNVLTQRPLRTSTNVVTVKLDVDGMADGQSAGLFHFTTAGYAGVGVTQTNSVRQLIYRSGLNVERGAEVKGSSVWLRSVWGLDGVCRFSRSLDGKNFELVGEPYQMKWASYRGDRIGLFNYNSAADAGYVDVDWFHYEYSGQSKP
jgi:beta-xylosidase/alpha-L-fucosidase